MTSVHLSHLTKTFGKVQVIKDLSLDIQDNEFTVFVGPSGCGKSTLLRLIAGLEEVSSGTIQIGGETVTDLPPSKRGIAMVFQSYALYPHMTVLENMAFGLKRSQGSKKDMKDHVLETAKILKLDHLLDRKPAQLSGGQRQRVAIGRAIVREPRVFLFDEPLSNLDASLRVEMRMQIARLKRKLKTTMIYVTHDQVEAMTLADRIVVLKNGQIEQVGTPLELYHNPRNLFVAGFLGSPTMNFMKVSLSETGNDGLSLRLRNNSSFHLPHHRSKDISSGAPLTLGIRPEHFIECAESEAMISGKVRLIEHLGSETYVYVNMADDTSLLVRASGNHPVQIGDMMHFTADTDACHVFDPKTELALERMASI